MGYWSALFFEDQSTWSSTVADMCSTIVSYGVEIPWCVCSNSWTVLSVISDYVTMMALTIAAFLKLDQWWHLEYSVLLAMTILSTPSILKRSKGDWRQIITRYLLVLISLCWLGCFMETASGIQGGIVFGGKLFYPSLVLFALACQGIKLVLHWLDKEVHGYGHVDEASKIPSLTTVTTYMKNFAGCQGLALLIVGAFALPKMEANVTDLAPWLCLFPAVAWTKEMVDYIAAQEAKERQEINGSLATKVAESVATAVKTSADLAAKTIENKLKSPEDNGKNEVKANEDKKEEQDNTVKCSVMTRAKNCFICVYGSIMRLINFVCSKLAWMYSKVMALPWEQITNTVLRLGGIFAYVYVFWSLTEDLMVLGFPICSLLIPMLVTKFEDKLGKENATVAREMTAFGVAGLQYYLFKTNIVHY